MNKFFLFIGLTCMAAGVPAQKCLNMNLGQLMDKLDIPASGGQAMYQRAVIGKGDRKQPVISSYGADLVQQDTFIHQTSMEFNASSVSGVSTAMPQMPSQADISDAKALAEKLQSMTPEQQKEFAMQMAKQQQSSHAAAPQESSANLKMLMQNQETVTAQLTPLNNEFQSKLLDLKMKADHEVAAVPHADYSKCPTDITGLVDCACSNKADLIPLKKILDIRDRYHAQELELIREYREKMKPLVAQVDQSIVTLQHGDALKTADHKRLLLSQQSGAFAAAYATLATAVEDIRKEGADAYLHLHQAELGLYEPCGTGK